MSRTEDYLDELLHSVSKKNDTESDAQASGKKRNKPRTEEDDFLSAFEQEILAGEDSDDFLQQFEKELDFGGRGFDGSAAAEENMESMQPQDINSNPVPDTQGVPAEDMRSDSNVTVNSDIMGSSDIPENLDDILSGAKEKMDEPPLIHVPDEAEGQGGLEIPDMDGFADGGDRASVSENSADGLDIMIDTMGDIPDDGGETNYGEDSELERRLGDIADATENLSGISELGDEFGLDEFDEEQAAMEENAVEAAEVPEEEADGKKKKKSRKERKLEKQKEKEARKSQDGEQEMTFLQKLSKIVFGEDEEEEEEPVKKKSKKKKDSGESNGEAAGDGAEAGDSDEDAKGKKKKKEKKPKQPKPKKEKKKKEKKPKPPKPKKEKKPKEPDKTPPLPKVPVFLIFVMAGSLLALVLLGTSLVGYTNQFAEAGKQYELGNYTEAYRAVRGMEIKEKDLDTFEKYRILATISGEYDSYQSFMELSKYDMALDSLIRAIGRSEKYREDAVLYECIGELEKVEEQATASLNGFGLDKTRALELYGIREKKEYSMQVQDILINAGLVTEE